MKKVKLLDGSCGSALWDMAEKRGISKVSVWNYNVTAPEMVKELHKKYIEAGCDMIQTNTFSLNSLSAARESDIPAAEIAKKAVEIAKSLTVNTSVKVYLSSGPLNTMLEPYGKLTYEECRKVYSELFSAAAEAGVDSIMLETFMDLNMIKTAAEEALKSSIPVVCYLTFGKKRKTMMGNSIPEICKTLEPLGISGIGMNCSYGPVEGLDIIKEFKDSTDIPLYYKPNAGMGEAYGPEKFAEEIAPALEYVSYIGGCCGTDWRYIREIKKLLV